MGSVVAEADHRSGDAVARSQRAKLTERLWLTDWFGQRAFTIEADDLRHGIRHQVVDAVIAERLQHEQLVG